MRGVLVGCYTLIQRCKLADLDPLTHLRDEPLRVTERPASRVNELTLANWERTCAHVAAC